MATVRFGLIGYGRFGSLHARLMNGVNAVDGVALGAVCTGSAESARLAGQELGVPAYADYRELLRDPSIDAVSIVLPNYLHQEAAVAALNAGKHVLLEKPMALSPAGCDAILAAARRSGKVLCLDHELHLNPLWEAVRRQIELGAVGDPRSVAIHLWRSFYRPGAGGWRFDPARVGNWIYEEPIHHFDLIRWYLGANPLSVTARGTASRPEAPDMTENLAALIAFEEGRYGVVTQTVRGYGHELVCEVLGTQGALRARWIGNSDRAEQPAVHLEHWNGEVLRPVAVPATPGEAYELGRIITSMVAAIRGECPPVVTGEDGAWAVAMCHAATDSVRTGQTVPVPRPLGAGEGEQG